MKTWKWALVLCATIFPVAVAQVVQLDTSQECEIPSPLQPDLACEWTGDCPVPGCANKCQANGENLEFFIVLQDMAFSERYYAMCPRLASLVQLTARGPSGSLPPPTPVPAAAPTTLSFSQMFDEKSLPSRRLQGWEGVEAVRGALAVQRHDPAAVATAINRLVAGSNSIRDGNRRLMQADNATAPAAASAPIPPELTLECPTKNDITAATPSLTALADDLETILTADALGELSEAERARFEGIVIQPNLWRVLIPYLRDPGALEAYMAANCESTDFDYPETLFYALYLGSNRPDPVPDTVRIRACADTFGGLDNFIRGQATIRSLCDPPFGEQPNCHVPVIARFVPSSPTCASALASAHNVSDAPLQRAQASIASIHAACQAVSDLGDCVSAKAPDAVAAVNKEKRAYDFRSTLDVDSNPNATGPPIATSPPIVSPSPPSTPSGPPSTPSPGTPSPSPGSPSPGFFGSSVPTTNAGPAPGAPPEPAAADAPASSPTSEADELGGLSGVAVDESAASTGVGSDEAVSRDELFSDSAWPASSALPATTALAAAIAATLLT